jgi:ribosome maturation protein SDO1
MQLGEKERNAQIEQLTQLITNYISENCVHPDSNRRFSQESIKQAFKEIHFQVLMDVNEKVQAKKCVKRMQRKFLIKRADMEIEI